jgi:UDP-N-acetylmuramoyl-tripeptide--D-alanyl-D-alanine ligase
MRTELSRGSWLAPTRVAEVTGGRMLRAGTDALHVTTDSRNIKAGDLFVALAGDQHDGHAFAAEAARKGACGLLLARPVADVPSGTFVVVVPDTRKALLDLAGEQRRHTRARVVGITGSCGKTSTKDMLGQVLAAVMPTVASEKSFNNEIGVPLTLFAIRPGTKAAVVEIGSNAPGEVSRLARAVRPDVAIVTCVAESHLQGLGSVEGVAREKAALVSSLRKGGLAVLNGDDPNVAAMAKATIAKKVIVRVDHEADWFATDVRFCGLGTTFLLQGKRPVTLPRLGSHNVYNALFTLAAAPSSASTSSGRSSSSRRSRRASAASSSRSSARSC